MQLEEALRENNIGKILGNLDDICTSCKLNPRFYGDLGNSISVLINKIENFDDIMENKRKQRHTEKMEEYYLWVKIVTIVLPTLSAIGFAVVKYIEATVLLTILACLSTIATFFIGIRKEKKRHATHENGDNT